VKTAEVQTTIIDNNLVQVLNTNIQIVVHRNKLYIITL